MLQQPRYFADLKEGQDPRYPSERQAISGSSERFEPPIATSLSNTMLQQHRYSFGESGTVGGRSAFDDVTPTRKVTKCKGTFIYNP